ncbi:hypothetical protein TNCT_22051 [Trichonephila clavata]|uniref:Uncharacterized protein n=1 Tax=Trichonephila clavata TaxID=2740835 RepID=A0A8X6JBW8_TRICU|nr:hypothetical protein TNCT_22051 [Trichonephila clavata]
MNYKEGIQSKNREIKWKLNPLPNSYQSTAVNIIKTTPGGHKICNGKEDIAVVSYIPKKTKNVILVSTLHRGKKVDNRPKKTVNDNRDSRVPNGRHRGKP